MLGQLEWFRGCICASSAVFATTKNQTRRKISEEQSVAVPKVRVSSVRCDVCIWRNSGGLLLEGSDQYK